MDKKLSDVPGIPWLRLCILVCAVILCLTEMSNVRAENDGPNPDKSEAISSQKTNAAVTPPQNENALISSIGKVMDDKLAPLFQKQATLEKLLLEDKFSGPKMTDVVGGIGWILGMVGIAAFFWSFKRSPRK